MTKSVTLYLEPELVNKLDSLAEAEERSRNYVAGKILAQGLAGRVETGSIHSQAPQGQRA